MSRLVIVAGAALALLLAAPALAADDVAIARAAFDRGARLYRTGKYREAIGQFEAAYRAKPHGVIHFNVAQCREKLEEWPGALRSYHDYLREVPEAADRAAVRAAIGRLERRLAATGLQALLVYSDPPGAEVRLDGKVLGRTPVHTTLPPRRYLLTMALDGYQAEERELVLAPDATRLLDVILRPSVVREPRPGAASSGPPAAGGAPAPDLTPPPPPAAGPIAGKPPGPPIPPARARVYTWIATGVAVGAAGAGAWYGSEAKKAQDRLRDGAVHPDAASLARSAQRKATTANVLYGISGAAVAGGVALFFVEGRF